MVTGLWRWKFTLLHRFQVVVQRIAERVESGLHLSDPGIRFGGGVEGLQSSRV